MPARRARLYPPPSTLAYRDPPCPEGLVRSWEPPYDCVPISAGRRALGVVAVVSVVALLLGMFTAGLVLAAGAARGLS